MIELANSQKERAIAVGLVTRKITRRQAEEYLEELTLLADTAGAVVIHKLLQERQGIDSVFYIGKGKVEQLKQLAEDEDISLLIFDDDLSPAQLRNLENEIKRKIVDRSGLILDIFAHRARSNEAKTQVELAQLQYLLPRLTRQWTHLSKQYGGIRTKGPGETQIETDRRLIRTRISHLKEKLQKITRQRETRRRARHDFATLALVGYTNAGKSTLMNALSESDVFVENRLFATLDTTTRIVPLTPNVKILLSDTVGFIRKLPHHLIASFKSTLEEVVEADILLHVIDICHPQWEDQAAVVADTLNELGAGEKPSIYVFNKIDMMQDRSILHDLRTKYSPAVFISAQRGINLSGLKESVLTLLPDDSIEMTVTLPHHAAKETALLHEYAEVMDIKYAEHTTIVRVKIRKKNRERIESVLKKAGATTTSL
jgi:GTP-binding protein HflX